MTKIILPSLSENSFNGFFFVVTKNKKWYLDGTYENVSNEIVSGGVVSGGVVSDEVVPEWYI